MFNWNIKESPFFTGIARGVGGAGFGKIVGGAGIQEGRLTIKMWGAAGGGWVTKGWGYPSPSSAAGAVSITAAPYAALNLNSGDTLYIYVAGGNSGNSGGPNGGRPGGGGFGAGPGTGGGGCTSIYKNGQWNSGTLMAVAGGGGGSSIIASFGWYPSAAPAVSGSPNMQASGGTSGGGNQTSGGPASPSGYPMGVPGSSFQGGNSSPTPNGAGGGGAAGYYGGGGGHGDTGAANGAGGGGGSNYHNPTIPSPYIRHHNDFQDIPNYLGAGTPTGFNMLSNPWPSFWNTFYPFAYPAGSLPGFNSNDPDYSFPRCGGTNDGPGNGQPGSVVIIDINGNKTTFTYTGSQQTYTVP
jgi:hypothetical protein